MDEPLTLTFKGAVVTLYPPPATIENRKSNWPCDPECINISACLVTLMYGGEKRRMWSSHGRTWGKGTLARAGRRWKDSFKINLKKIVLSGPGGGGVGRGLARSGCRHGHVVGSWESGNEPSGSVKCGQFIDYQQLLRFSIRTFHRGVSCAG